MSKQELIKKYQEIVLNTNGGNDDYVVALCQIGSLINELDDPSQQIAELKEQLEEVQNFIKLFSCENFEEFKSFIGSCRLTPAEKEIAIVDLQRQLKEQSKQIEMLKSIKRYDIGEMLTENAKLKAQLHTQPREIVEKIEKAFTEYLPLKDKRR